jgi:hypothetical protein
MFTPSSSKTFAIRRWIPFISKYLICDISKERPNVYYELGYAHGIGKEVILIAKHGTTMHFDIKDYNTIFYRNITELEDGLTKRISAIVDSNAQQRHSL